MDAIATLKFGLGIAAALLGFIFVVFWAYMTLAAKNSTPDSAAEKELK